VDSVHGQLNNEEFIREHNFAEYLAGKNSHQIKIDQKFLHENDISSYLLSLGHHYINTVGAPFPNIKMGSVWINYSYKGDFNPIHTHDSLLSGVMYIHQDDGITEEQERGSHSRATSSIPGMTHFVHDLNYHPFNKFTYSNPFVKGELLMFPSWLTHWVNPFVTDGERITVAFNILEA
jgi:uncharacterized protein (TIGR02466 family)